MAFAALILEIKNNEDLDQMALAAAQRFSRLPSKYSIGIKKLLNYDKKDLCTYLAFEHELLGRQIHSCNLHNFGRLNEKL